MCNHVERLYEANMADVEVTNLLRLKLVDSLSEINTAIVMGRVLYLLGKSPSMDDNFFVMITNHIHRNQLYPAGDSPRLWCRYFKFIGDNRIYHRPLLEVLAAGFYDYLADRVESATGPCSRRMQEAVALASWALAISAPDLALDHLFGLMLRFVAQPGVDRSVVIRVYWSSAISNRLLENLDIKDIGRMLDETLAGSNVGPRHKSHLHQIYTTLRCLNMAGIEDKGLTKRCLESLHALRYGYNDSKISTSQRYVSDVLVRLGVPHRVEVLTPDLLSIDIAIEGDGEQIALEVDGPLHFIRVCDGNEDSTPMHTGPTRAKQTFLRSSGWLVVSAPPVKLDDGDDLASSIASVDMYYKKILMNSGSKYLNRLLG
ncbi:RAP domain-containing protein, putative [Babesia ovis]|uniref:RAP domain-containing protein, putative n=1 Tax=Babesia ovis TaxID=5869 RepID=A0A9W5T933_BABOV|nr:RAP domain-containing protein, putative [Babesia ovis]